MDIPPTVIFLIILFAVPLQIYLSPKSTSDAKYYLSQLVNDIQSFFNRFISSSHKSEKFESLKSPISEILEDELIDEDDAKATDFFGGSHIPRDPRSPHIKYKIGQILRHKIHGYRAVIVGWDEKAKAPNWWLKKAHKGNEKWRDLPNYTILIDTRDRLVPQVGYIVEENVIISKGKLIHPLIDRYFESFDGTCYKPRPWLRKVYPNDV